MQKKQHVSTWVVDSRCSRHMTDTLELLSSYLKQEGGFVAFGGNQKGKIKGYGMIVKGEIKMNQVSYVDGLKDNLISAVRCVTMVLMCFLKLNSALCIKLIH